MLFSYFNLMCISMYLLSELDLEFSKKKCVQKEISTLIYHVR